MTSLNNQILTLERARKNYEKAYKEGEKAKENFQKADADLYLSRADVEKQRMNMTFKLQQCEETKAEYANQLKRANELQVKTSSFSNGQFFAHYRFFCYQLRGN